MPSNKMLIDASHPEETRVVVLRGNKVEEFDFESSSRRPLKGNIYLAKVTRVEPSLQAAFIEYGGNRHGFLAFSEIHPDYYQIPYADRQALLEDEEDEEEDHEAEEEEGDTDAAASDEDAGSALANASRGEVAAAQASDGGETAPAAEGHEGDTGGDRQEETGAAVPARADLSSDERIVSDPVAEGAGEGDLAATGEAEEADAAPARRSRRRRGGDSGEGAGPESIDEPEEVESVGAEDALEEVPRRRVRTRQRQYKIQEVIKRRQVLLVQVVKEERGNKGAALTTYLSLAGRYCVLMPNTGRGGGISRKITNAADRKRLKEIATELQVPDGMGVILRTAGANRTKPEIKRDFEYLLRLWESIRDLTLGSTAPSLIYEEGSLIKRSIRDLYAPDIGEIVVAGDEAYTEAVDFMSMLMPGHEETVRPYREPVPLFARHRVEHQLDQMFSAHAPLPSGGYIVLNQAEALVAIDVNSGRSTREHSIEDTALQTNLEAAEEIARQIRLRDLAGLIVIDFIDMEEKRNNKAVERQLKESLRADRARIQVGRISHFGLLEMSRQRLRTGVLESSSEPCPHCHGTGQVRSMASLSLQILRAIEEQLMRNAGHHLRVATRPDAALYMLNQKRAHLVDLEQRFGVAIAVHAEAPENGHTFSIERGEAVSLPVRERRAVALLDVVDVPPLEEEAEEEAVAEATVEAGVDTAPAEEGAGGRRRRRRRRGHRPEEGDAAAGADVDGGEDVATGEAASEAEDPAEAVAGAGDEDEQGRKRRRRGRRGGRRRGEREGAVADGAAEDGSEDADREESQPEEGGESAAPDETPAVGGAGDVADDVAEPARSDATIDGPSDAPAEEMPGAPGADEREQPMAARDEESVVEALAPVPAKAEQPEQPAVTASGPEAGTLAPEPNGKPAEAPSAPASEAPQEDDRPKRTGWWTRRSFF